MATNRNVRTGEFKKLFDALPEKIRNLAEGAYKQFQKDPHHSSLRLHQLGDSDKGKHRNGSLSVSITMKYRAIFVVDGSDNVWYWIGSHNDYENFIGDK